MSDATLQQHTEPLTAGERAYRFLLDFARYAPTVGARIAPGLLPSGRACAGTGCGLVVWPDASAIPEKLQPIVTPPCTRPRMAERIDLWLDAPLECCAPATVDPAVLRAWLAGVSCFTMQTKPGLVLGELFDRRLLAALVEFAPEPPARMWLGGVRDYLTLHLTCDSGGWEAMLLPLRDVGQPAAPELLPFARQVRREAVAP